MPRKLALSLAALLLSYDLPAEQWASAARIPSVGIFLDFDNTPAPSLIRGMEKEVAAVLATTGVRFSWLSPGADTLSNTFDQLAVLRFHGTCRMELGAPGDLPDSRPRTLAATQVASGTVSPYSSVLCDQVRACISGALEGSCDRDRETALGRALGRVVAHELFHILGNTREHTREGIAKALQNSADLIKENFHFDRQALAWLRQRLQFKGGRAQNRSPERGAVSGGSEQDSNS